MVEALGGRANVIFDCHHTTTTEDNKAPNHLVVPKARTTLHMARNERDPVNDIVARPGHHCEAVAKPDVSKERDGTCVSLD